MANTLEAKCKQLEKNSFQIDVPLIRNEEKFEHWHLSIFDPHFDSMKCYRDLLKKHCDQAGERRATINIGGDLFDAMGGKYDPRSSKGELRPEYQRADYLDEIIEDSVRFFKPYAKNLTVIGQGNHESSILDRLETDLTQRFVGLLRAGRQSNAYAAPYKGWIKFQFTSASPADRTASSVKLAWHHGSGFKTPSSRIRFAHEHPDADIIEFGHHHTFYHEKIARFRLSQKGVEYLDHQTILGCPSYKHDVKDGTGWAVRSGHSPKVPGAWWIRFFYNRAENRVLYECIEAR